MLPKTDKTPLERELSDKVHSNTPAADALAADALKAMAADPRAGGIFQRALNELPSFAHDVCAIYKATMQNSSDVGLALDAIVQFLDLDPNARELAMDTFRQRG
jgi:hypothetical protein